MYRYYSTEQAKIRIKRVMSFFTKTIECLIGSVCRRTRGWGNDTFFSSFLILIFKRREKFAGSEARRMAGRANAEAAAAIPFPLKPLFLAAAADAMIC